jgi:hypothetical protein
MGDGTGGITTIMLAYQLLARLRHLTLVGQDDEGELQFVDPCLNWTKVWREERAVEAGL